MGLNNTRRKTLFGSFLFFAIFMVAFCSPLPVRGQTNTNAFPPSTNTSFTSSTKFAIPTNNSTITFASGGSYANASLNNDIWNFAGLFTGGGYSALPNISGVGFSVSAENCNVTITHMDALNVFPPPVPGEMDYTVSGVGTQTFNFHYSGLQIVNFTVCIDGKWEPTGDGWTMTPDGWLTVTGATSSVSIHWAEVSIISFSQPASFPIPRCNGSINFASGGTYLGYPTLANNTWTFQNLALAGSVQWGIPLWTFATSAENSNITVDSYNPGTFVGTVNGSAWLNYTVAGSGTQRIYFTDSGNGNLGPQVYIDSVNKTLGDGWTLSNGWITITGATSDVGIYYPPNAALYGMPAPVPGDWGSISQETNPTPLFVLIGLIITIAVVVAGFLVLRHRKTASTQV